MKRTKKKEAKVVKADLVIVAKELNELGIEPPIDVKEPVEKIRQKIELVFTGGVDDRGEKTPVLIEEDDEFSPEAMAVINKLGLALPGKEKKEEPKPKSVKKAGRPPKKTKAKKTRAQETKPEEVVLTMPVPAKRVTKKYTRAKSVADCIDNVSTFLFDPYQDDNLAEQANKLYHKQGGKDDLTVSKRVVGWFRVVLQTLLERELIKSVA